MHLKGVTPIVSIIILLLIVITFAGFAYSYISAFYAETTAKVIQIRDIFGNTVVVNNLGTQPIDTATDMVIFANGLQSTILNDQIIQPGKSASIEFVPGEFGTGLDIRIRGASNTVTLVNDIVDIPGTCTNNDRDKYAVPDTAESCGPVDCDDNNPAINPGATEICDDGGA